MNEPAQKSRVLLTQVIEDLRKIFGTTTFEERVNGRSFEYDGNFFIDKREKSRKEVLILLSEYFKDKVVADGQCRVENTTLLHTMFCIEYKNKIDDK